MILAVAALVMATPGYACQISVTPMTFGDYLPSDPQAMQGSASLDITCPVGVPYQVSASEGFAMQGFAPRYLQHSTSTDTVAYNLFLDPMGQEVWGDGTPGTKVITGTGMTSGTSYSIYGAVFPNQQAGAGSYSDAINILVEW